MSEAAVAEAQRDDRAGRAGGEPAAAAKRQRMKRCARPRAVVDGGVTGVADLEVADGRGGAEVEVPLSQLALMPAPFMVTPSGSVSELTLKLPAGR